MNTCMALNLPRLLGVISKCERNCDLTCFGLDNTVSLETRLFITHPEHLEKKPLEFEKRTCLDQAGQPWSTQVHAREHT